MAKQPTEFDLTEHQVLHFRARRGHLAGAGAADAAAAACAIIGAQSQQLSPSLLALSMRMKDRPTAAALKQRLLDPPREIVRTWGQRGTLFAYDPADWELIIAARREWTTDGRRGAMPPEKLVVRAWELVQSESEPVTRRLRSPPRGEWPWGATSRVRTSMFLP